jgi:high-affinity K+ transport system ATPase subunit B
MATLTEAPPPVPVEHFPHRHERRRSSLFDPRIVRRAVLDAFVKLNPRTEARNPIMFVVLVGAVWTSIIFFRDLNTASTATSVFGGLVSLWLWFTVLFANFAEALAEGRGKAQADTLRRTRSETVAHVRQRDGPGDSFIDRMIALVEGADRQKTPNEIALNILLAGLTIAFVLAVTTLQPYAVYSSATQSIIVLVGLLVCLAPTTIGALLSAIGIAGMDRPCPAGPSRPRATCRRSCSTRRERSPTATAWRRSSSRSGARASSPSPRWCSSPAWPTRHPRVAQSSPWPRSATA